MTQKLLEICCYSLQSGLNAQLAGADRIELCGGRPEGGTTPSFGLAKATIEALAIPAFLMIRPRGGDFCYSESEARVMIQDIRFLKTLNPGGFVFGALKPNGTLDLDLLNSLTEEAGDYPVTFHRAFDMCIDPFEALEQMIELGIKTLLTSGQLNKAPEAIENLKKYKNQVGNRLNIMAGSGVNPGNISAINSANVDAFHFSASRYFESNMLFRNPNVKMGDENSDEYQQVEADIELIKKAKEIIETLNKK